MLEIEKTRIRYKQSILAEIDPAGNEPTADEVLDLLLGDPAYYNGNGYHVYEYRKAKKRTFMQRFNLLWVYPLFIVSLPLQWLALGQVGMTRNSRIGKIVDWLVKI